MLVLGIVIWRIQINWFIPSAYLMVAYSPTISDRKYLSFLLVNKVSIWANVYVQINSKHEELFDLFH